MTNPRIAGRRSWSLGRDPSEPRGTAVNHSVQPPQDVLTSADATDMATGREFGLFLDSWETGRQATALIVGGRRLSYGELDRLIDERVLALGERRRLVLIESASELEPLVTYLAALRGRHVAMVVPPGPAVEELIETYQPDSTFGSTESGWTLTDLVDEPVDDLHPDLAVMLSTSGSTGASKFVRLSRSNLGANAEAIADYLSIAPTDCALLPLPLHYCYGLSVLHSHLLRGASVVVTDLSVVDPCFWDLVAEHDVATFPAVPFTFDLLDRIDFASMDVPSLRYITQAGGKLAPEKVERYACLGAEKGFDLVVMYGATEATARMAYLPPEQAVHHPAAIGQPIPGGSFELADDGELIYRGPNVMMGYANGRADLARGPELDELRTGDLARRNEDGFFEIVGRKSRFLKLFGLRVSLDEIERFVSLQFGGVAAATGTDEHLVVALEGRLDVEAVRDRVTERFGLPPSAVTVRVGSELPRLENGKVDYVSIRATVPEPPTDEEGARLVSQSVASLLGRALGRPGVAASDTFVSLGGDSLSYVEVSIGLEEILGHVPPGWHLMTVAELEAARTSRGRLRAVETGVVIRALAIMAIMADHFELVDLLGGAHVLLAAAGYNFSRFTAGAIARQDSSAPIAPVLVRIAAPTSIWVALVALLKADVDWSVVFYVSHLDRNAVGGYWFIEVLVQILLVAALLFSVPALRRIHRSSPYLFAVGVLTASLYLRFGLEAVWNTEDLGFKVFHMSFWLFAIGWVAEQSTRRWQRACLTLVTLVTVPGFFDSVSRTLVITVGILALIWIPTVSIPSPLHRVVGAVGAASLYLYLVHFQVNTVVGLDEPLAKLGVALVFGLIAAEVATRTMRFVSTARLAS